MSFVTFQISVNIPSTAQPDHQLRATTLTVAATTPALPVPLPAGAGMSPNPLGPPPLVTAPVPNFEWLNAVQSIPCRGAPTWSATQFARLWVANVFQSVGFDLQPNFVTNATGHPLPFVVTLRYTAAFNPGNAPGGQLQNQATTVIVPGPNPFDRATIRVTATTWNGPDGPDEYLVSIRIDSA